MKTTIHTTTVLAVLSIIATLSFLGCRQKPEGQLTFAVGVEFYERPDGFKKLLETYDFQPSNENIKKMSIGLTYKALRNKQVDVAMGFATDGRIEAFGFTTLKDNKQFFPVYNPAPVVRAEVLEKHPEIRETLAPLADNLSTDIMRRLNKRVDVDHKDAKKVALNWLKEQDLISDKTPAETDSEQPSITVGGKNFTEQYLLAEMAGALLRQAGFDVNLTTGVGSVIARKSLVNDQIDLYYEYTGTAYTVFYDASDPQIMRDPEQVYEWVKENDAEKGLTWLPRVDFNNTYTLIMREEQAKELGITSISDLAGYVNKFQQANK